MKLSLSVSLNVIAICFSLLFFTGCQVAINDIPDLEDSTRFMDKMIDNLGVISFLNDNSVSPNNKIVVQRMDSGLNLNPAILEYIEGRALELLTSHRFIVLDRSKTTIDAYLKEKSLGSFGVYTEEKDRIIDTIATLNVDTIKIKDFSSEESFEHFLEKDRSKILLKSTNLGSADYLLMYRVLEVHIIHVRQDFDVNRKGVLKVYIKLVDLKTDQILASKTLEAMYQDKFPENSREQAVDFNYSYFENESKIPSVNHY